MKNFYKQFKTPIVVLLLFFVGLFLYTNLAGPIQFSVNSITTTKTDLFSSSGQGEESAIPDTATVSLGVTGQAQTVTDAQNKINQSTQKILTAIKKLGISEKDIKTTNYSVSPNYGRGQNIIEPNSGASAGTQALIYPVPPIGGEQQIIGYTVTQNIEVKVKPIDKANKVVDAATANGANLVGGINFTFSDELQKSLEQKARTEAVKAAKEKAQNLANAAGIRLGKVVNVIESSNQYPRPYALAAGTLEKTTDQNQPTNITPGENTVTINVTIYYETY